jgi:hypothetical protein
MGRSNQGVSSVAARPGHARDPLSLRRGADPLPCRAPAPTIRAIRRLRAGPAACAARFGRAGGRALFRRRGDCLRIGWQQWTEPHLCRARGPLSPIGSHPVSHRIVRHELSTAVNHFQSNRLRPIPCVCTRVRYGERGRTRQAFVGSFVPMPG